MRPIAISLSPNVQKDDVWLAAKLLLSPWKWNSNGPVEKLEIAFQSRFGKRHRAYAVNSGRSAEYLILKALGIGKGDEVVVQAFTCVAVPNSIIWTGAKPIYCDITDEYNIDTNSLEGKLSKNTRAIIVQHTFGIPAEMETINNIIQKAEIKNGRKIYIIEDCAHSLGAMYKGKPIGTLGDVAFFSFGRDKVISSVFGGMVLVKDRDITREIKRIRNGLRNSNRLWVFQQLLHPIAFSIILPTYRLGFGKLTLGKGLLVFLQKLRLLSKPVYKKELACDQPSVFPARMAGALAKLARNQLNKLDKFNKHRVSIAKYYLKELRDLSIKLPKLSEGSIWLRFPIRTKEAEDLYEYAKKNGVLLGNWYHNIIDPKSDLRKFGYESGSCPRAEKLAQEVVNLPTYPNINKRQADSVIQLIKQWQKSQQEK